jgi:cyanophycinase
METRIKDNKTFLFLLGGSPAAYRIYADEFVAAAGGRQATIAVMAQNRSGWEKYQAEITRPWLDRGVVHFVPVTPDEAGRLDQTSALAALSNATGIFISGGNTPTYHQLFASGTIGAAILKKYRSGVPVAGISAGALISLSICPLTPLETGEDKLKIVQGLGLASGFVIGVHFSECNALPEVLEVMAKTKTGIGYGIDKPACMVFENGRFTRVLGKSVYRIEMTDFNSRIYRMLPIS